jgi:type II secretion system protein C
MLALLAAVALASSPPDLQVVGVVVARSAGRSVAILRCAGRTRVAGVGDSAFGGRLVAVAPNGATLDFGGTKIDVRLTAAEASTRPEVRPAASAAAPEAPGAPVRAMEKKEVERRLGAEIPRILAETAVSPVMQDGKVTGLMLTRVPDGTLLSDAGLQAGDVLTEINDTRIDGMATLIGLWPRLQNASDLRAMVLRNGQPVSLSITIKQ